MSVHVKGSDILVLIVSDLGQSRAFYRDTLGMTAMDSDEHSSVFRTDAGMLLLLDHEGAGNLLGADAVDHGPRRGATAIIVAAVEDVDATYAALMALGVEFVRPPEDREWGLRTAHLKDPDGNIWELHTPLASG